MIIDAVLILIYGVAYILTQLLQVLPVAKDMSKFSASMQQANAYINSFSMLLPLDTLFYVLSIVVAIEFGYWTYKGIVFIRKHIPFIGG